jgi:hypothetical protein
MATELRASERHRSAQAVGKALAIKGDVLYLSIQVADPLAGIEAALKKLRQDPGNSEALEALEQAVKQLRERTKPKAEKQDAPQPR